MDDETFARLLGEDAEDAQGAPTAVSGPSAADETAIEAAVPDGEDTPEDAGDETEDEAGDETVQAEDAEEEEATVEAEAEAEVIPISDPRHPDHAYYQRDQENQRQQALVAQAQREAQALRQLAAINQAIEGLPDADPATLPGTVRNLIGQVVAPIRQEAQAHAAMTEEAAAVGTTLHLAMVEHLPPEWVEFIVARSRELRSFRSVEAASHVVTVGKQAAARDNATIKALREENALLKKTAKANGRNPDADRVPAVRPASSASRSPAEGESRFDRFFRENVTGR